MTKKQKVLFACIPFSFIVGLGLLFGEYSLKISILESRFVTAVANCLLVYAGATAIYLQVFIRNNSESDNKMHKKNSSQKKLVDLFSTK